jgi:hypothetical protein
MELREEIADYIEGHYRDRAEALAVADSIIRIPEIADALLLMRTAQSRFAEALRPADPADVFGPDAYQNAHPWARLLKREDLPTR